jgi:hypothetical protein
MDLHHLGSNVELLARRQKRFVFAYEALIAAWTDATGIVVTERPLPPRVQAVLDTYINGRPYTMVSQDTLNALLI